LDENVVKTPEVVRTMF
jgi:hypothetical protein